MDSTARCISKDSDVELSLAHLHTWFPRVVCGLAVAQPRANSFKMNMARPTLRVRHSVPP